MTKYDLIEKVGETEGLPRKTVALVMDAVFSVITEELREPDGKVSIQGFGTFSTVKRKARKGRNPRTGESVEIPAGRIAKWKPAPGLLKSGEKPG